MDPDLLETPLEWWALLPLVIAVLLVVAEVGFRIGQRYRGDTLESQKSQTGLLVGAMLALLGLLLAFSFGIVEGRYAERKALVLADANAIGTTYLRAQLLPPAQAERVKALLRSYVAARLSPTAEGLENALTESEDIQRALWHEAATAMTRHAESEAVSLFVQSLNEMIDLHESRVTIALHQRMPTPILATLYVVSLLSIAVVGFSAGLSRWRSLFPTAALVIAVSSVVVLIVELDRPLSSRMFRISQSAMQDVQEAIAERRP